MPQSWMPQSAEAVWTPSSAEPIEDTLKSNSSIVAPKKDKSYLEIASDWMQSHPSVRRFFGGPTPEDIEQYKKDIPGFTGDIQGPGLMKVPGLDKGVDKLANVVTGSEGNARLAAGALIKGAGSLLEGGFDPRTASIKPVPRIDPNKVQEGIDATKAARSTVGLDRSNRLGLPPAPETPPRQFIAGPKGVADTSQSYKLDLGDPLKYPGRTDAGTLLPREVEGINDIPAELAARQGLTIGDIPKFKTDSVQEALGSLDSATKGPMDITDLLPPKKVKVSNRGKYEARPKDDFNIGDPNLLYQSKSAEKPVTEPLPKAQIKPTANAGWTPSSAIAVDNTSEASNASKQIKDSAQLSVKDAIAKWAYGQQGAKVKGNITKEKFADLSDPSLIDKYESGDRTGGLADVEKLLKERLTTGKAAGIFKEGQEVPNYLRHEFEQSPEEVRAALKSYIAKNPSIAKTRRFATYADAEAAGLTRKYKTLPEVLGSYETKFNKAIKDKELYDWAVGSKRLDPQAVIKSPDNWTFKGSDSKEASKYLKNALGNLTGEGSPEAIKKAANVSSFAKNLYLGSGIPKTPLNMHMYNISRSDVMARGIKNGLGDFFSGVFKPGKDKEEIVKHANSGLLGELVDHGMGWTNIEDHAGLFGADSKVPGKDIINKITGLQQKVFEDPLFKIHLPAVKLRFANERVSELLKRGASRDSALSQAAKEANDFYGGVNKILRNKTYSDLSRIGLLAPDWLESRANLAGKGALSLIGKADPIYAKALARGAGMRVAGSAATAGLTGYALNQSKRATNSTDVPIGKTATGLNRDLPIYGSAVEGLKIPEEVASGRDLGNVITSRLSQPAKSVAHIIGNEDSFGNPLRGQDKYGRPISTGRATMNTAKELAAPIVPPYILMLQQLLSGKDPEAAIATGMELPLKYNSEPGDKKNRLRIR